MTREHKSGFNEFQTRRTALHHDMAAFTSAIGQPPHTHTALFWANSIPLDLSDTTMADVSTVKGDVYLVAHVKSDKGLWKVLLSLHLTSDGDVAGTAQYEACTSKSSKKKAKGGTGEFKRLERGDGATVLPRKMGMVRAGAGASHVVSVHSGVP